MGQFKVLVVDDEPFICRSLSFVLRKDDYEVFEARNGEEALDVIRSERPDLVFLDVMMPKMGGLEACRILKAMGTGRFLPVLLVTTKSDTESRVTGLRLGADDYLCKPVDEDELIARVEGMLRIKALHDDVSDAKERLTAVSIHDETTGLYNYRYLHDRLTTEFKRAERYHDPLTCMMVDVDGLARFNRVDRKRGDDVLVVVAEILKRALREVDVVARFGADEFLVVLPSTHFAGSVTVAERIWRKARQERCAVDGNETKGISVSIGISLFPSKDVKTKDSLVSAADNALTQAKQSGGDRICVYQQEGYLYTPMDPESPGPGVPRNAERDRVSETGFAAFKAKRAVSERPSTRGSAGGPDISNKDATASALSSRDEQKFATVVDPGARVKAPAERGKDS